MQHTHATSPEQLKELADQLWGKLQYLHTSAEDEYHAAVGYMHIVFILEEKGEATERYRDRRQYLFEKHGHALIHEAVGDDKMETVKLTTEFLMILKRTLESPIDDADKLAHLREELLPKNQEQEAQLMDLARTFGFA